MSQVLDKKLHAVIDKLNDKQKKAILSVAETFALETEKAYDHWQDESFVAEMDNRYSNYKAGKAKVVSLDEVEKKARKIAAKNKS